MLSDTYDLFSLLFGELSDSSDFRLVQRLQLILSLNQTNIWSVLGVSRDTPLIGVYKLFKILDEDFYLVLFLLAVPVE